MYGVFQNSLRRLPTESDEAYYMRILYRYPDEQYEEYKERILATKKVLYNLPVWSNREYVNYAPVDISKEEKLREKANFNRKQEEKTKDQVRVKF